MPEKFIIATLWLGLAIYATMLARHLKISVALVEICVGVAAGSFASLFGDVSALGTGEEWLKFLATSGAVLLTFLAGAELDKPTIEKKWKEVLIVGAIGFLAPFLGCAAVARFVLGWGRDASLLTGVALSTTSMAVVYSVMVETGLNKTDYGKGILGACFVNDLGTVIALGVIFAPFSYKSLIFIAGTALVLILLPHIAKWITLIYSHHKAAVRTKWILLVLFGTGALALWADNEAVLPAYLVGMVLAGFASKDSEGIKRIRTLTVGFLTPFYFIRAGMLVSLSALITVPLILIVILAGKLASKTVGLYPVISFFRKEKNERWFYTLLMSTGLTFGTISALYGYSHNIISKDQYSFIVGAVIASAVVPAVIASVKFIPRHLIPPEEKVVPATTPQKIPLPEQEHENDTFNT
ncbi:MAG: cation:proton antiporter [Thermoplasmata archaeon]